MISAKLKMCVEWTIKNLVPFSVVEGEGFVGVAQAFAHFGASYGHSLNIKNIIPHRTTISNNIDNIYNEKLPIIKNFISKVQFAALTTDMWSDQYRKLAYISLTIHFMRDNKNIEQVLAVKHFDYNRQSGENIKEKITSICSKFHINLSSNKYIFVTDNFISALTGFKRISCAAHILNNSDKSM